MRLEIVVSPHPSHHAHDERPRPLADLGPSARAPEPVPRPSRRPARDVLDVFIDGANVTARVREESIDAVHLGAPVDVLVDANPGAPVTGTVGAIGATSAGVNQLDGCPAVDPLNLDYPVYPGSDTDPQNPQAVQQYIPVKILFTGAGNARITPGESDRAHPQAVTARPTRIRLSRRPGWRKPGFRAPSSPSRLR